MGAEGEGAGVLFLPPRRPFGSCPLLHNGLSAPPLFFSSPALLCSPPFGLAVGPCTNTRITRRTCTRSFMLRFSKAQDGGKCRLLRKSLAGRRSTRWRPCPCLLPCQDHLLKMLFAKGCLSLKLPTYCIVSTEESSHTE